MKKQQKGNIIVQSQALHITCTHSRSNSLVQEKPRYCNHCKINKPDRTHHCRKCNRCILKMVPPCPYYLFGNNSTSFQDHHCPFTRNCIGFYNYKFLITLLFWANL